MIINVKKIHILEEKFRWHLEAEFFTYSNTKVTSDIEKHMSLQWLLYN